MRLLENATAPNIREGELFARRLVRFRRLRQVYSVTRIAVAVFRQSDFFDLRPLDPPYKAEAREALLLRLCAGKRVTHFGFVDAPVTAQQIAGDAFLHGKLRQVASRVHGVDYDESAILEYRTMSGDSDNSVLDLDVPLATIPNVLADGFDVLLVGEVIEHVLNPGIALSNIARLARANNNALVCVTVPNALSLLTTLGALRGREIVHPEHHFYFSPVTLRRLLTDSGYQSVDIGLYTRPWAPDVPGITQAGVVALCYPDHP